MKLRETILAEHTKANRDTIIQWVGQSQQRFDQLFNLFLKDESRVVQRAAWPLSYIVIKHPKLIQKHFTIYPEIKNELKLVIEERWDDESPAFRSRARKILKKIS